MSKRMAHEPQFGRSQWQFFLLVFAALAGASCDEPPTGVTPEGVQPSRLEYFGDPARIEAPEQAIVGAETVFAIESYGGGCIEPGPTVVEQVGPNVIIRPKDIFPDPDRDCFRDLVMIDHSVALTFHEPGEVSIEIHGAKLRSDTDGSIHRDLITITRSITVLPAGS